MGLKTLKDIDTTGNTGCGRCESIGECCGVCQRVKIRKEAINHIKELETVTESVEGYEKLDKYGIDSSDTFYTCMIIDWIKHFFNITEEDLK